MTWAEAMWNETKVSFPWSSLPSPVCKKGYTPLPHHISDKAIFYSLLLNVTFILTSYAEQSMETQYYYNYFLSMIRLPITSITLIRLQLSFVIYAIIKIRGKEFNSFLPLTERTRDNHLSKAVSQTNSLIWRTCCVCYKDTNSSNFLNISTQEN